MIPAELLQTFSAFADDANLSRSAKRLHLSQPAVHAQLKRLAELLGVVLYQRAGRGLVLTNEGRAVAAFARDSADRECDFVARLRGETTSRRVVLAAGAGALLHVLGDGLRAFTRSYDGRLEVLTADAPTAIDAVTRGTAHVGVVAGTPAIGDLETRPIREVGQVLVVPSAHRLATKRRVLLADLDGERLVLPPEGRPQRLTLDAAFATRGVRITPGAVATGWELVVHLVTLGIGLAIVNASVKVSRALVAKPLGELPRIPYVALTRRRPLPDAARLVAALTAPH